MVKIFQVDVKRKKDYEKLFIKLNYVCQTKRIKEGAQLNSWCKKNVSPKWHYLL